MITRKSLELGGGPIVQNLQRAEAGDPGRPAAGAGRGDGVFEGDRSSVGVGLVPREKAPLALDELDGLAAATKSRVNSLHDPPNDVVLTPHGSIETQPDRAIDFNTELCRPCRVFSVGHTHPTFWS